MALSPAPVRVPGQRPLAQSGTSVANDKSDNEMIPEAVHRSRGIFLTAEENLEKSQLVERLMKRLCDHSSPQMGSLTLSSSFCVFTINEQNVVKATYITPTGGNLMTFLYKFPMKFLK